MADNARNCGENDLLEAPWESGRRVASSSGPLFSGRLPGVQLGQRCNSASAIWHFVSEQRQPRLWRCHGEHEQNADRNCVEYRHGLHYGQQRLDFQPIFLAECTNSSDRDSRWSKRPDHPCIHSQCGGSFQRHGFHYQQCLQQLRCPSANGNRSGEWSARAESSQRKLRQRDGGKQSVSVRDGHQYWWFQRHDFSGRDQRDWVQLEWDHDSGHTDGRAERDLHGHAHASVGWKC